MLLEVLRFADDGETTLGILLVDGVFECFTVEDQEQKGAKVMHETRVPNGTYDVKLRNEGGYSAKYAKKYADMHKGMLCISNKPNWKLENNGKSFQYILIHTGNNDDHTSGCLLVNDAVSGATFTGSSSRDAYIDLYPKVAKVLEDGGTVKITYKDIEYGK
jgi:hypothetical protein